MVWLSHCVYRGRAMSYSRARRLAAEISGHSKHRGTVVVKGQARPLPQLHAAAPAGRTLGPEWSTVKNITRPQATQRRATDSLGGRPLAARELQRLRAWPARWGCVSVT